MSLDTEVLMAGFGGQGMLLAGKVLAQASMDVGREVSWLPSYGPEMRGGTANVMVCIASKPIGSPLIESPRALVVMNLPSLEKFAPKVKPGGVIIVNQSLIDRDPARHDCIVIKVLARELAQAAGAPRAANFVMLGAYAAATDVLPVDAIERAIAVEFAGDKAKFVAPSIAAFRAGVEAGRTPAWCSEVLMAKVLMKGNEALGEAAIRAGCVHFFGYPITPQTEVPEYLVKRLPEVGGAFVQAESEVAAINMVYGAAGVGMKCMTSSSSPGISLMAEGLSYIAACELPCVVVNIMRAGPGLGGILPSQSDYLQATKGHGHGDYRLIVLAPSSVQEAVDLMTLAFELADKYRNPVMVCADGMIGQMMEPVEFPGEGRGAPLKDNDWALTGRKDRKRRIVNSLFLAPETLNQHNIHLKQKYDEIERREQRWELYNGAEPYDLLITAFGTMARICKTAIDEVKKEGRRVALFRPITLNPYPYAACRMAMDAMPAASGVLSVEMNMGQMVWDVKHAAEGTRDVQFFGLAGGLVPSPDMVAAKIRELVPAGHLAAI